MATPTATRPPLPPFKREYRDQKVHLAEDAWNTRDPGSVALGYAIDSRLEEPIGVHPRTKRNRCFSLSQVDERIE
jgi:nuclear transport factor 2 (NTF2) superfamily protein